jgi:hypothetical protein
VDVQHGSCTLASACPTRAVAPALHLHLHMLTSSSLTEARKQAQAEEEYYKSFEHQQGDSEQRHDSKVSAFPPDIPASEPVSSANSTLRAPSPIEDWNTLIARIATERRGSDNSLKTAYTAEDTIPALAYRSRPDLRSDPSAQHTSVTASVSTDDSSDEEDLIATFTDY